MTLEGRVIRGLGGIVLFALAGIAMVQSESPPYAQQASTLEQIQTVVFPDLQGGFNHMSADAEHQRLFAAAPTNKSLEIVDLRAGKPWRSLGDENVAAARYAPEFDQLYATRGQSLYIYDGKTFEVISSIGLQSSLDELQYDPRAKELYVGCMSAEKPGIAIISIPDGKLLEKIALPGKPQGIVVEKEGQRIFANVPSAKQITVINRNNRKLPEPWLLRGVQGNTPIDLDEDHHRLFVGARRPAQLLIIDTNTGRPVAEVGINNDADDLFYDSANKRVYVSCGEGFIDVIEQRDGDHYELVTRIPTVAGARTSTFSAQLKGFYLGVPRTGDKPAEIRVFSVKR